MKKKFLVQSVFTEYGIPWAINRMLYSCKLKMLGIVPKSERLFETRKNTEVKHLNVFSISTCSISKFLFNLSDEAKVEIITEADNASRGIIKGFSSISLDYGNPIDWQMNPLTRKRCDASAKWYQISDFDPNRGDIKVIWEASRFTHFYMFSRAYLLTGDEKYYRAFSKQMYQWLRDNPYSFGANYKCGQECALRIINALMTYTVFREVGLITNTDEENVKELISRCYKKILSNFFYAYRCIKNNHTISELVGMIIGAWCCDDKVQLEVAYSLLDKVICEQFTEDGGYSQFSFNYQRLALQDIECVMSLNTQYRLSAQAVERVRQSAILMYQCQSESGDVPNYGSNDGALIFPVTSCDYRDYRATLNCIYAMTVGARLYPSGIYDEELLWFAGGIDKYTVSQLKCQSECYTNAGLYTIRRGTSLAMIVLNNYKSRPAHMDQLHLDLWIDGINVFCDSGTYSYVDKLGAELAATGGHNTAKVIGIEQMTKNGAFMLSGWTRSENIEWTDSTFKGTIVSKNGYRHRREVTAVEDGYEIIDEVEVSELSNATVELLFHTPCEVEINDSRLVLRHHDNTLCSISCDDVEISIETVERSLYYLKSEFVRLIRITNKKKNDKVRMFTKINIDRRNLYG